MGVQINVKCEEYATIAFEDLVNFCRDIIFIHDRLLITKKSEYRMNVLFTSFFYTRYGRPIEFEDQLKVIRFTKESPFEFKIEIVRDIADSLIKILKLIRDWGTKKEMERENIKREVIENYHRELDLRNRIATSKLDIREKNLLKSRFQRDIERLMGGKFKIVDVEVEKEEKKNRE